MVHDTGSSLGVVANILEKVDVVVGKLKMGHRDLVLLRLDLRRCLLLTLERACV